MSELTEVQMGFFCLGFLLLGYIGLVGREVTTGMGSLAMLIAAFFGMAAAGFCLAEVLYDRHKQGDPA